MQDQLPLNIFVKSPNLWLFDKFKDPHVFSYLGKKLEAFINQTLDDLGVGSSPVIHGNVHPQAFISGRVYIAEGATVEPTAMIQGPCIIGPHAEVRHAAYIRGNVFVGAKAVVGHTTEVKGSVFFDHAKAGHFAYVGDSILGYNVNLGAGTKLANLKLDGSSVSVKHPVSGHLINTGLRKFSAIMGDESQTGCNAVLSPGTILMPKTLVMSCVHYRGTLLKGIAK